jgi:hypothetical protein
MLVRKGRVVLFSREYTFKFQFLNVFDNIVSGRGMHIEYCWEIQKERDHWEDQDVGGWTILK